MLVTNERVNHHLSPTAGLGWWSEGRAQWVGFLYGRWELYGGGRSVGWGDAYAGEWSAELYSAGGELANLPEALS